ncbi:MAG: DUF2489 domain-containing protein [Cellvibrionaceae bacterium]
MSIFSSPVFWGVAATLVIVVLAVIAGYYLLQLRRLREKQKAQLEAVAQAGVEQRLRVNKSIQIINQSLIEGQMTITEGAIRTKVLLDGLSVTDAVRDEFSAFYELAAATDHIPILEAWKALSTKQKLKLDSERETLEAQYRDAVLDAARRIQGQFF